MADHSSLSVSDLKDIQAGPVYALFPYVVSFILTACISLAHRVNIPTRNTTFLFFAVKDVGEFRKLFKQYVLPNITTSDAARGMREEVFRAKISSTMAVLAG